MSAPLCDKAHSTPTTTAVPTGMRAGPAPSGPAHQVPAVGTQTLPPELLHSIVSLARPSSTVPTTCALLRSICQKGHETHIAWRNARLLLPVSHQDLNNVTGRFQLPDPTSNLGEVLLSLLPPADNELGSSSTGAAFAPSRPPHPDPVFTPQFLRYLFTCAFVSANTQATRAWDTQPGASSLVQAWWGRSTDLALLIPVYLLRAGQLDSLETCLQLLLSTEWGTSLLHSPRPWNAWRFLFLDKRHGTITYLRMLPECDEDGNPQVVTYPLVLAVCALLDWSLPTIDLLLRLFPTRLTRSAILYHAFAFDNVVYESMCVQFRTPAFPDKVDRIIDLHQWLRPVVIDMSSSPLMLHLQLSGAPFKYLKRVVIKVDLACLVTLGPGHRTKVETAELLECVAGCVDKDKDHALMDLVIAQAPMTREVWVEWMTDNLDHCWRLVQQHVLDKEQQREIAIRGFYKALSELELLHNLSDANGIAKHSTTVVSITRLLRDTFHLDWLDVVLEHLGDHRHSTHAPNLLSCLNGTELLANPATALTRTLDALRSTLSPRFPDMKQLHVPCTMAAMLFHMCASSADLLNAVPDCVQGLSPSQLAVLVVAMLVATSLAQRPLRRLLPLDQHQAAVERLVAHAKQGVNPGSADAVPFFDRLPVCLQVLVIDMTSTLVDVDPADARDVENHETGYFCDAHFATWVLSQLVLLDSRFVAAAVINEEHHETPVLRGLYPIVPLADQVCAKASDIFVCAVLAGKGGPVGTVDHHDMVRKDVVLHMARWMMTCEAYMLDDGQVEAWAQRQHDLAAMIETAEI